MHATQVTSAEAPSPKRRVLVWLVSLVGAVALAFFASRKMPLWPMHWAPVDPLWLALALLAYLPYVWLRAERWRWLLAPLVERPDDGATGRSAALDRAWIHGTGYVSFFAVLILPLRLGEFSRPLLLARAKNEDLGFPEGLAAQASERIVDGLLIVGMLFGGLAASKAGLESGDHVRVIGAWMGGAFALASLVLLLMARVPARLESLVRRIVPGALGQRLGSIGGRVAHALQPLFVARVGIPFLLASALYWAVTVLQLWALARAFDLGLSMAGAAAIVAIVGLSIQLPGGPAQLGSFQVGMATGLGLYLDATALAGPGASFAAAMYLTTVGGAALAAIPGLALLRRARRRAP